MRSAIAERLDIRRRHESQAAEAVLTLRKIWQQRQPENLCKFGIWTQVRTERNGSFLRFTWRDTATGETGFLAHAPTQNFEHIDVAAALLSEISALRSAAPKKPAIKEERYAVSQRGVDRMAFTHNPERTARDAATG